MNRESSEGGRDRNLISIQSDGLTVWVPCPFPDLNMDSISSVVVTENGQYRNVPVHIMPQIITMRRGNQSRRFEVRGGVDINSIINVLCPTPRNADVNLVPCSSSSSAASFVAMDGTVLFTDQLTKKASMLRCYPVTSDIEDITTFHLGDTVSQIEDSERAVKYTGGIIDLKVYKFMTVTRDGHDVQFQVPLTFNVKRLMDLTLLIDGVEQRLGTYVASSQENDNEVSQHLDAVENGAVDNIMTTTLSPSTPTPNQSQESCASYPSPFKGLHSQKHFHHFRKDAKDKKAAIGEKKVVPGLSRAPSTSPNVGGIRESQTSDDAEDKEMDEGEQEVRRDKKGVEVPILMIYEERKGGSSDWKDSDSPIRGQRITITDLAEGAGHSEIAFDVSSTVHLDKIIGLISVNPIDSDNANTTTHLYYKGNNVDGEPPLKRKKGFRELILVTSGNPTEYKFEVAEDLMILKYNLKSILVESLQQGEGNEEVGSQPSADGGNDGDGLPLGEMKFNKVQYLDVPATTTPSQDDVPVVNPDPPLIDLEDSPQFPPFDMEKVNEIAKKKGQVMLKGIEKAKSSKKGETSRKEGVVRGQTSTPLVFKNPSVPGQSTGRPVRKAKEGKSYVEVPTTDDEEYKRRETRKVVESDSEYVVRDNNDETSEDEEDDDNEDASKGDEEKNLENGSSEDDEDPFEGNGNDEESDEEEKSDEDDDLDEEEDDDEDDENENEGPGLDDVEVEDITKSQDSDLEDFQVNLNVVRRTVQVNTPVNMEDIVSLTVQDQGSQQESQVHVHSEEMFQTPEEEMPKAHPIAPGQSRTLDLGVGGVSGRKQSQLIIILPSGKKCQFYVDVDLSEMTITKLRVKRKSNQESQEFEMMEKKPYEKKVIQDIGVYKVHTLDDDNNPWANSTMMIKNRPDDLKVTGSLRSRLSHTNMSQSEKALRELLVKKKIINSTEQVLTPEDWNKVKAFAKMKASTGNGILLVKTKGKIYLQYYKGTVCYLYLDAKGKPLRKPICNLADCFSNTGTLDDEFCRAHRGVVRYFSDEIITKVDNMYLFYVSSYYYSFEIDATEERKACCLDEAKKISFKNSARSARGATKQLKLEKCENNCVTFETAVEADRHSSMLQTTLLLAKFAGAKYKGKDFKILNRNTCLAYNIEGELEKTLIDRFKVSIKCSKSSTQTEFPKELGDLPPTSGKIPKGVGRVYSQWDEVVSYTGKTARNMKTSQKNSSNTLYQYVEETGADIKSEVLFVVKKKRLLQSESIVNLSNYLGHLFQIHHPKSQTNYISLNKEVPTDLVLGKWDLVQKWFRYYYKKDITLSIDSVN